MYKTRFTVMVLHRGTIFGFREYTTHLPFAPYPRLLYQNNDAMLSVQAERVVYREHLAMFDCQSEMNFDDAQAMHAYMAQLDDAGWTKPELS